MMWPLLLSSIITIAIAIERICFYRRSRTDMKELHAQLPALLRAGKMEEARQVCEKAGGIAAGVLAQALKDRATTKNPEQYLSGAAGFAASRLKDYLNYVSAIVTLSPLMGLLGTVTGMIRSFDILSISEGQPFAITGGVAEALVATGFGLLVAIVAMIIYVWLTQKANRLIEDIEAASSQYLACFAKE